METELGLKIKELREKGYSYNLIVKTLNCAKSSVAYHCGSGQIAKTKSRNLLHKVKNKERDKKNRQFLLSFSQRYKRFCGCKVCGEKDPVVLQYDHRDRSSKISTVTQLISDRHSFTTIKEEIRKCDILCANCHLRKTAKQLNWHANASLV